MWLIQGGKAPARDWSIRPRRDRKKYEEWLAKCEEREKEDVVFILEDHPLLSLEDQQCKLDSWLWEMERANGWTWGSADYLDGATGTDIERKTWGEIGLYC